MSRTLERQRRVMVGTSPSKRVLHVCAAYGLVPIMEAPAKPRSLVEGLAGEVLATLKVGEIGLLSGPSGSGKSLALQGVRTSLGDRAIDTHRVLEVLLAETRAVVDALDTSLESTLSALSLAGLAEPMLWIRPPATLSDGERARLSIAASLMLSSQRPGSWVLIDECCALLDAVTASSVAHTLRRWVSRGGHTRVLCASSREELAGWLKPDRVWNLSL